MGLSTMKVLITGSAGSHVISPGWVALIVTSPGWPVSVTVSPLTVAGPERTWKWTGSPEVAVASILKGASVVRWGGIWGKDIAW